MTSPALFEPARLGPLTLRNRFIKAATFEGMTKGALVNDELIAFHRRHAAGGVAMTTVAYCAVAPEGRTERDQIWMRPEALPGLRRLTEAVHAEGAAVSAQIGHAGPVADGRSNGVPALGPSASFSAQGLGLIRQAGRSDIERITRAHAEAALLAVEAGFDAVEIHLGHNYFASSFLSPKANRRSPGRDALVGFCALDPPAQSLGVHVELVASALDRAGPADRVLAGLDSQTGRAFTRFIGVLAGSSHDRRPSGS